MPIKAHEMFKKQAASMRDVWRLVRIDSNGRATGGNIMAQLEVFKSFPEINPRFFENFGVVELTIRQANGTQIKLMKVR